MVAMVSPSSAVAKMLSATNWAPSSRRVNHAAKKTLKEGEVAVSGTGIAGGRNLRLDNSGC